MIAFQVIYSDVRKVTVQTESGDKITQLQSNLPRMAYAIIQFKKFSSKMAGIFYLKIALNLVSYKN